MRSVRVDGLEPLRAHRQPLREGDAEALPPRQGKGQLSAQVLPQCQKGGRARVQPQHLVQRLSQEQREKGRTTDVYIPNPP